MTCGCKGVITRQTCFFKDQGEGGGEVTRRREEVVRGGKEIRDRIGRIKGNKRKKAEKENNKRRKKEGKGNKEGTGGDKRKLGGGRGTKGEGRRRKKGNERRT